MRGGEPGAARVEDRGDGTYAVTYTLPAEGAYQIAVTGPDARHVRGSPVAVTVFRCARAPERRPPQSASRACTLKHYLRGPSLSLCKTRQIRRWRAPRRRDRCRGAPGARQRHRRSVFRIRREARAVLHAVWAARMLRPRHRAPCVRPGGHAAEERVSSCACTAAPRGRPLPPPDRLRSWTRPRERALQPARDQPPPDA